MKVIKIINLFLTAYGTKYPKMDQVLPIFYPSWVFYFKRRYISVDTGRK